MKPIVVTAGEPFTDVDSLACAVAYAELLKLEGREAEAVLPGPYNASVTSLISSWDLPVKKAPSFNDFEVVAVDISRSEYFANFVAEDMVTEVYDHHHGYEGHWRDKIGENSHIESVGACATLIYEQFANRGKRGEISELSANLLSVAIVSNTLNFKANTTTLRDTEAYHELETYRSLPDGWIEKHFNDQAQKIFTDPRTAVKDDTKVLNLAGLGEVAVGQIELWEGNKFIAEHQSDIEEVLKSFETEHWFLTVPSISEGKNYILVSGHQVQVSLGELIDIHFEGNLGVTEGLYLRKEIEKKFQTR